MAYTFEHYSRTYQHTQKANFSSSAIQARYPFICSRDALYNAILKSGVVSSSQRNPNSYTVKQITDKIVAHWDDVMYDEWTNSSPLSSPTAFSHVLPYYKWDQAKFWSDSGTYYIAWTNNTTNNRTAEQVYADTDVILLPSKQYFIDTKNYQQKPFLGLDTKGSVKGSGDSYTLIGTDDYGNELTVDGDRRVTAITNPSSGTHDDTSSVTGLSGDIFVSQPLVIYDYKYYHDDLNVNGSVFDVNPAYAGADTISTSTKWFDLRNAKFSVTTSGGVVTAIANVARNDGDGTSISGGWGYSTDNDYQELYFIDKIPQTTAQIRPRVLFRTDAGASNSLGNKATVDIAESDAEFYEGLGQSATYIDTAFAIPGLGDGGGARTPTTVAPSEQEWYQRAWPYPTTGGVDPHTVRIISERPTLKSETRGLKTTTVGTGAQRYSFEFEYPPMNESEATEYIQAFEKYKGASLDIQLYIPSQAIQHVSNWVQNNTTQTAGWSNRMVIVEGSQGSSTAVVDGHIPGTNCIANGNYFTTNFGTKVYKIVGSNSSTADDYGRVAYTIEPPLVRNEQNAYITADGTDGNVVRIDYMLIKAKLVDDVLDYTVDAAGIYRMSFKFVESMA